MKYFFVLTLLMFGMTASAQQRRVQQQQTVYADTDDRLFADAIVVPTSSGDSATVTVFFRMSNDMLTFTKVVDPNDIGGNFKADMKVSAEVRDGIGVIRQRLPWTGTAYVNTFEETNARKAFHYGWISFTAPPGERKVTLEVVTTKESTQRKITLPTIKVVRAAKTAGMLAPPIVAEPATNGETDSFRPFVNNGNVPFQPTDVVALMMVGDVRPRMYDYVIRQQPWGDREIRWWRVGDVRGEARSEPGVIPVVSARSSNDRPLLSLVHGNSTAEAALLRIPIAVTSMVPASYTLEVIPRGEGDTIRLTFRVYWEKMPLSLRNAGYAIELCNYVLTDQEFDDITDGNDAERRERLMDYWRKHDPTPATTFNEHLAEYYRRVDAAFYAYSSIQEPDGAKSDRGKIYILHGPATSVTKSMSSDGRAVETWTYTNKVNQVFTFMVDPAGAYVLTDIQPRK
ncbi:MAG: GWxTD domain-containing protein [Candidatus Kapabacteria bacterium]|nr:GWxTD domain-containing protein [Candidatus Kapabacteria bacterium]